MNYNKAELCKDCKMPVKKLDTRELKRKLEQASVELYNISYQPFAAANDNRSARRLDKARRIIHELIYEL